MRQSQDSQQNLPLKELATRPAQGLNELCSQSWDVSPDVIENVQRLHNPVEKISLSRAAVHSCLTLKTWAWQAGPKAAQQGQGPM